MSKVKEEMEGGKKEMFISGDGPGEMEIDVEASSSGNSALEFRKIEIGNSQQNPLTIFPEELWEVVLNSVDDSVSVYNVLLAYPQLLDKFKEKIPFWLLGEVFPHLLPYLNKKDVQSCTHVCRTWRSEISQFAEEHRSLRAYNEKEGNTIGRSALFRYGSKNPVDKFKVTFNTSDSIQTFLRIGPNHLNPFIGRNLTLSCWSRNDVDVTRFNTFAKLLLEEYGKYVWHFYISSHEEVESGSRFFRRLARSLSLLPNLRSLTVCVAENIYDEPAVAPYRQLPPLRHLESLNMTYADRTLDSGPITLAILRRYVSEQLRFLSISMDGCAGCFEAQGVGCLCDIICQVSLTGLTELKIKRDFRWQSAQNHFERLLLHLPKESLQKLDFVEGSMWEPESFKKLSGFHVGMVEFHRSPYFLGEYCNKECETSGKCTTWDELTMDLPNLHSVCFKQHTEYGSYKFLAKIPSLEKLEIVLRIGIPQYTLEEGLSSQKEAYSARFCPNGCHYDQITKELTKWIYQDTELNKSLLWNLLPGLQSLKIRYSFEIKKDNVTQYYWPKCQRVNAFHRKEFNLSG